MRIRVRSAAAALVLGLMLVGVGCSAIRSARETQRECEALGTAAEFAADNAFERLNFEQPRLEELVAFALTNRPSVTAAHLAVEDARLQLKAIDADAPVFSRTPWNAARISLSGGYAAASPGANWSELDWNTVGGPSAALSLDLLVWDFGRHRARATAQVDRVLAAELSLTETGYAVFQEVSEAYFTLMEKSALLAVATTNRAEYAERLRQVESRLEVGEAKQLDVLRARNDLALAVEELVVASNALATAAAETMRVLGLDLRQVDPANLAALAKLPLGQSYRAFADTDFTAEAAFLGAGTNAPTLSIARARLRAASADVDYALANLLPEVSVPVSFSWVDPLWVWSWGVQGLQSIFEGRARETALERARVALAAAAATVREEEQRLSCDLAQAVADRDNAREGLRSAREALRSAIENLNTVRAQVGVGDATRVDFANAVSAYAVALSSCVKAFYSGQRTEARLFALQGLYPVYDERVEGE